MAVESKNYVHFIKQGKNGNMIPMVDESFVDQSSTSEMMSSLWLEAVQNLRSVIGKGSFDNLISPLVFKEFVSGRLVLAAPTRFIRDWVSTHHQRDILSICQKLNPKVLAIDLILAPESEISNSSSPKTSPDYETDSEENVSPIKDNERFSSNKGSIEYIDSALDPRFTFENFVVGKPNELAYAAARRVAESETVPFNPLFLYGGVGLGKTHLMHAIAWQIRLAHPQKRVIYLSAEKFMYQFIKALRFKNTVDFKEQFRSVDVLMIDDVQFISGKDSTQEEFFHTFNALVDQNRQVIVSADKSPSDLEGMADRLKSRLGWGLVADVHPTTYELRLGILQTRADKMGVKVPQEIVEFLAHKITSNVRELEGALTRIVAHSSLVGGQITLDITQSLLRDLIRANDRQVNAEDVQKKVAEHFNVRVSDMHSAKRARTVARPRQIAMYLVKSLTTMSLPEVGRKFGGRDHTTVMHAIKKVEDLMKTDSALREDVELLKRTLQN